MILKQHPVDPTIMMLVDPLRSISDGAVIPASFSRVGVDLDGSGLAMYRKGNRAYGVGWWPHMRQVTVSEIPLDIFESMARCAKLDAAA